MSEKAAKQTRREIRRAVGPAGLDAVNQLAITVHTIVAPAVADHERRIADLERLLTERAS